MENKRTLVIGASMNPARYSYLAIHSLQKHGNEVVALAKRKGNIADIKIQTEFPGTKNIHTVTMYVGEKRQLEYYNKLVELKPKRVIFNPGAENNELAEVLENKGIEVIEACTLVMLSTGQY
ncbi:MAG: CoA-binding protein [Prolixibacteraceae bacterium]|jgi:uncharacterized protein|nr:CoA-binding protein [Prolixibacteraceae bacterium]MBT6007023.1 CoA-binding protein [Prolixibacteraceae bacterium]MBT6767355.1 CoA-binding protein [Prolixibacteraceae bacterium]MBT6997875.1 CoA-binding protein [Prolixibacteraceae bacterium]MBT7394046.1 CoA-binding protein [Prolixibacteraceae bacterium]